MGFKFFWSSVLFFILAHAAWGEICPSPSVFLGLGKELKYIQLPFADVNLVPDFRATHSEKTFEFFDARPADPLFFQKGWAAPRNPLTEATQRFVNFDQELKARAEQSREAETLEELATLRRQLWLGALVTLVPQVPELHHWLLWNNGHDLSDEINLMGDFSRSRAKDLSERLENAVAGLEQFVPDLSGDLIFARAVNQTLFMLKAHVLGVQAADYGYDPAALYSPGRKQPVEVSGQVVMAPFSAGRAVCVPVVPAAAFNEFRASSQWLVDKGVLRVKAGMTEFTQTDIRWDELVKNTKLRQHLNRVFSAPNGDSFVRLVMNSKRNTTLRLGSQVFFPVKKKIVHIDLVSNFETNVLMHLKDFYRELSELDEYLGKRESRFAILQNYFQGMNGQLWNALSDGLGWESLDQRVKGKSETEITLEGPALMMRGHLKALADLGVSPESVKTMSLHLGKLFDREKEFLNLTDEALVAVPVISVILAAAAPKLVLIGGALGLGVGAGRQLAEFSDGARTDWDGERIWATSLGGAILGPVAAVPVLRETVVIYGAWNGLSLAQREFGEGKKNTAVFDGVVSLASVYFLSRSYFPKEMPTPQSEVPLLRLVGTDTPTNHFSISPRASAADFSGGRATTWRSPPPVFKMAAGGETIPLKVNEVMPVPPPPAPLRIVYGAATTATPLRTVTPAQAIPLPRLIPPPPVTDKKNEKDTSDQVFVIVPPSTNPNRRAKGFEFYPVNPGNADEEGSPPLPPGAPPVVTASAAASPPAGSGPAKEPETPPEATKAIDKFGRDITALARSGKLDPVVGRDALTERAIQILTRRTKNVPVFIGEPGVGKTAVVEGVAHRIVAGDVPDALKEARIIRIEVGLLQAGANKPGDLEGRVTAILREVEAAHGKIIPFFDELHTLMKLGMAQGQIPVADLLKPALARGEFPSMAATTLDEYRKFVEMDEALARRFQTVFVEETDRETTITILRAIRELYENHHEGTRITDDGLIACVDLAKRYVPGQLPDIAISLLDEVLSRQRLQRQSTPQIIRQLAEKKRALELQGQSFRREEFEPGKRRQLEALERELEHVASTLASLENNFTQYKELAFRIRKLNGELRVLEAEEDSRHAGTLAAKRDERDLLVNAKSQLHFEIAWEAGPAQVAEVVSVMTGIPSSQLTRSDRDRLVNLEQEFEARVIAQPQAASAAARAIRRARSGVRDPKKPVSFLAVGPTGIGKTALARAIATILFDDENAILIIDGTEYSEKHNVARLIGAPPGYVGYEEAGKLTEAVRRRPYLVVLVDELEKMHPDIRNIALQIMDEGRLTDGQGREVNFKHVVFIATSNVGADVIATSGLTGEKQREAVQRELEKQFVKEFLNRFGDIIIFNPLGPADLRKVVDLEIAQLNARLKQDLGLEIRVDHVAKDQLAKEGYDPVYGVRPLKRVIERRIEDEIATFVISSDNNGSGMTIGVTFNAATGNFEFKRE